MDRRLIDLEMQGLERALKQRERTVDLPMIGKIRSWLGAWKTAYGQAFDVPGPELSEKECRARVESMRAWIAYRKAQGDDGRAGTYQVWLEALEATMALATKPAEPPKPQLDDVPLSLEEFSGLHHRTQVGRANKLPGEHVTTAVAAQAKYAAWVGRPALEGADT